MLNPIQNYKYLAYLVTLASKVLVIPADLKNQKYQGGRSFGNLCENIAKHLKNSQLLLVKVNPVLRRDGFCVWTGVRLYKAIVLNNLETETDAEV